VKRARTGLDQPPQSSAKAEQESNYASLTPWGVYSLFKGELLSFYMEKPIIQAKSNSG
jgi:hypothetical protein